MPGQWLGPNYRDVFGGPRPYLGSTDPKPRKETYTVWADACEAQTIDGESVKGLQRGTIMALITSGPGNGYIGPYQPEDGTNEIQTATITGSPTGGTFTLSFGGQTTGALNHNATGATVQAALEALSTIGEDNVTVSLSGAVYTITFRNELQGTNVAQITASASLTGGSTPGVTMATGTGGVAGATDGRQTDSNIVGALDTYLPWQLNFRDVEVAVTYDGVLNPAECSYYDANGVEVLGLGSTQRTAVTTALPKLTFRTSSTADL